MKPTLFHGTDAKILRMPAEEIKAFRKSIVSVLEYLWQFYEPYTKEHQHTEFNPRTKRNVLVDDIEYLKPVLDYDKNSSLYENVQYAIFINSRRIEGKKQWQYDDLCVTNWEPLAWNYAKRSYCFGEIGLVTYQLIKGAKAINFKGWNPNPEINRYIEEITAFAESEPEPVVIEINDWNITDVRDEGGECLKDGFMSRVFVLKGISNLNAYPVLTTPSKQSEEKMLVFSNGELVLSKF